MIIIFGPQVKSTLYVTCFLMKKFWHPVAQFWKPNKFTTFGTQVPDMLLAFFLNDSNSTKHNSLFNWSSYDPQMMLWRSWKGRSAYWKLSPATHTRTLIVTTVCTQFIYKINCYTSIIFYLACYSLCLNHI